MIIVNTTFLLHNDVVDEMLTWIRDKYLASAGRFAVPDAKPLLTRVLSAPDDESKTYAVHVYFPDLDSAARWNEGVADRLRRILADRWGERVLTFHTYLEVTE